MGLFELGNFTLHSGDKSHFLINCDALTDEDWRTLAFSIKKRVKFGAVIGIPEGGMKLAHALSGYVTEGPTLIVDDVLTTGASMEHARKKVDGEVLGIVAFARSKCPWWVLPISDLSFWLSLGESK